MRKTKYTVKPTTQFRKDYKLAMKRGLKIGLLEDVVSAPAMGVPLPEKNKDHALSGNWTGHRECTQLENELAKITIYGNRTDQDIAKLREM